MDNDYEIEYARVESQKDVLRPLASTQDKTINILVIRLLFKIVYSYILQSKGKENTHAHTQILSLSKEEKKKNCRLFLFLFL